MMINSATYTATAEYTHYQQVTRLLADHGPSLTVERVMSILQLDPDAKQFFIQLTIIPMTQGELIDYCLVDGVVTLAQRGWDELTMVTVLGGIEEATYPA